MADSLVWIALAVGVIVLGIAGFFGIRWVWTRAVRRALVSLVSRREAVFASRRTLEAVVRHLADEDDVALEHFATHPESEDRRSLAEVTARMGISFEELDTRALPGPLVAVAEGLADAAYVIHEEAGRVGESDDESEVFDALTELDLVRVATVFEEADARVKAACERYHLDEAAVYGGGLYI